MKEPDFVSSCSEDRDAEEGVGSAVHDSYLSKNGAEVCAVGAVETGSVTKDNVERPFPALRGEIELADREGVGYRDVGATVHHSWFVDLRGHAGGYRGCELGGGPSSLFASSRALMRVFSRSVTKAL